MNTGNRYIDFEVSPCVLLDEQNEPRMLSAYTLDRPWTLCDCDESDPSIVCWSVFGVLNAAGRESIADYLQLDMAENLAMTLRQGLDLIKQKQSGWDITT